MPDYIFETSWEVCNRVGGIYTVLSSRAKLMQLKYHDQVVFFGPDLKQQSDIFFREQSSTFAEWRKLLAARGVNVRVGRWLVPGKPIAVLIDYSYLWEKKDEIYGWAWNKYRVQSHAAMGDYDDSSLFGYAVGQVMESLYDFLTGKLKNSSAKSPQARAKGSKKNDAKLQEPVAQSFIAHCNEWQTAFTIFYLREHCPRVATVFTTHATGIGRSIAGNNKPLYDYFTAYNGTQMASELGMVSKHSAERQAAHFAHCFTTVSDLTARECAQLLDKPVDIVTENGFEPDFVPAKKSFALKREQARTALRAIAAEQCGGRFDAEPLFCCISGRLEWKNKGIDVFLDAVRQLRLSRPLVAYVMIPYLDKPAEHYGNTHIIFCPYYLNGTDPMFNPTAAHDGNLAGSLTYYDLLIGMDLTVFPSYYEPWGYTPLESVAFHVPTVTTDLSGFGQWAQKQTRSAVTDATLFDELRLPMEAVTVIHRTDSNRDEVVMRIAQTVRAFSELDPSSVNILRQQAADLAAKATWQHFFPKYEQAYQIALSRV